MIRDAGFVLEAPDGLYLRGGSAKLPDRVTRFSLLFLSLAKLNI